MQDVPEHRVGIWLGGCAARAKDASNRLTIFMCALRFRRPPTSRFDRRAVIEIETIFEREKMCPTD